MTKEEVAQVIAYCDENKISYKQRLSELGISPWSFYDAKRKYAPKEEGDNAGEFLQLIPGGAFLPNPIKPSRSRSSKQKESAQESVAVNIELRTPTGTMMRIIGNLTGRELKEIIIASSIRFHTRLKCSKMSDKTLNDCSLGRCPGNFLSLLVQAKKKVVY